MRKEWVLALLITLLTVAAALGAIRWLAPQLLGRPADLRLVQVAESKPAFYDGAFADVARDEDASFLVNDPVVVTRGRGLLLPNDRRYGPHDLLGFRNPSVPVVTDVVAIGDSQTYGNNADVSSTWPTLLGRLLGAPRGAESARVYSMAIGGWSAPQYGNMIEKALALRPRVAVLAFYSGNDAVESFVVAYGNDLYADLRLDPKLDAAAAPKLEFPPPEAQWWTVPLAEDLTITFTPAFRLAANDRDQPAVRVGWQIMAEVARRAQAQLAGAKVALLVTVIPTKELAYAPRLTDQGVVFDPVFTRLVEHEKRNIDELAAAIRASGATYVDVLGPLQQALRSDPALYPADRDGHPVAGGYHAIARALAEQVAALLPAQPRGLVSVMRDDDKGYSLLLINDQGIWHVTDQELLVRNGWKPSSDIPTVSARDLAGMPWAGMLTEVDPARFGPASVPEAPPTAH